MTEDQYDKLKRYVASQIFRKHRSRHVEDCTQYVAMKMVENPKLDWKYAVIDYLRMEGVTQARGKKRSTVQEQAGELLQYDAEDTSYPPDFEGTFELAMLDLTPHKELRDEALTHFTARDWSKLKTVFYKIHVELNEHLHPQDKSRKGLKGHDAVDRIRRLMLSIEGWS